MDKINSCNQSLNANCCPPNADAILQIKDLTIKYNNIIAIEKANLEFLKNEITAIVGPSGCGKSSLLKSINRLTDLNENCKVTGSIFYNGQDLRNANTNLQTLRRNIGMVFQQPNPFPLSIYENLNYPLKEHGLKDKAKEIIETTLKEVGLWEEVKDRLNTPALQLSGGQQQRLCLARCLALQPKILLLDEPCSSLDPMASKIIEELILKLKTNYTIIIVTHNIAQAKRIADKMVVCWLNNNCGCILESGNINDVLNYPQNPQTKEFCIQEGQ